MVTKLSGRPKTATVTDVSGDGMILVIKDPRTGDEEICRYRDHSEKTVLRMARKIVRSINPDPGLPDVPFSDVVETLSGHVERAN